MRCCSWSRSQSRFSRRTAPRVGIGLEGSISPGPAIESHRAHYLLWLRRDRRSRAELGFQQAALFLHASRPARAGITWCSWPSAPAPLAGLVAFSHLQFSQIRGRQPYLNVRKILYVIAPLICWSFSSSMFKYLFVDHAVPAMCRSLAAARFKAD